MCEQINFHLNLQLLMYVLIFKYMVLLAVKKPLEREISIHHLDSEHLVRDRSVLKYVLHWGLYVPSLLS